MIVYSRHAKERAALRNITAGEVFAIIANPTGRRDVANGNIDFFGASNDGRPFQVTIDPSFGTDGRIVTIIDIEADQRARQGK